jgi:peptidoglycan/LPS O-acetylase OafA/YrhL
LLAPINLEFLMGMSVALLARTLFRHRHGQALIPISILSFCGLLLWVPPETHRVLYGIPFATLVLGFVCLEQQVGIRTPRWLVHLGDASYSIYLTHDPAISAAIRLLVRLPLLATWWTAMFATVATGVAFGICYHHVVEKPLMEVFRRVMLRLPGSVAARNT